MRSNSCSDAESGESGGDVGSILESREERPIAGMPKINHKQPQNSPLINRNYCSDAIRASAAQKYPSLYCAHTEAEVRSPALP